MRILSSELTMQAVRASHGLSDAPRSTAWASKTSAARFAKDTLVLALRVKNLTDLSGGVERAYKEI